MILKNILLHRQIQKCIPEDFDFVCSAPACYSDTTIILFAISVANSCWRPQSIRGQVRQYVRPTSHGIILLSSCYFLLQHSREDFTVMSRISSRRRRRDWQFNYQTRNFATLGPFDPVLFIAREIGLYLSHVVTVGILVTKRSCV